MTRKKEQQDQVETEIKIETTEAAQQDSTPDLEAELAQCRTNTCAAWRNLRISANAALPKKADWISMRPSNWLCTFVMWWTILNVLSSRPVRRILNPLWQRDCADREAIGKCLEKEGVQKIEALGEPFNPEFHDALAHIPSE
jgi:molecular chaperone GrpE (heat shock protein)